MAVVDGGFHRLPQWNRQSNNIKISRIMHGLYGSKALFMRNTNLPLSKPKSHCAKRIEGKQFAYQKFKSTYLMEYFTKSESKSISVISMKSSTLTWQWNEELKGSKSNLLEEQWVKSACSRLQLLQIQSWDDDLKFDVWIEAWKCLDLAQMAVSIFMFLSLHNLISARILQIKAWSALNYTP